MTLTDYINRRAAKQNNTPAAATAPLSYDVDTDSPVRAAWNLSIAEWLQLTDMQRRDYRWNVSKAPHFKGIG